MMRKLPFLTALMLYLLTATLSAQYYNTGQDPASLRWMEIKTGRFNIIYPENYRQKAFEFARSLEESDSQLSSLFGEKKFRIPVIIHNQSTMSNGYVAWAPRRMEIYPTPEQNGIPLDPDRQLTLHELAHVYQMKSLYRGFSRGMSVLMGEQFTGVVSSLLPLWFLEGDAVLAETVFSGSGRGWNPSFQKQFRAQTYDDETFYKYDKVLNGSFRDYVPDHYQSGYQMVTWAIGQHGNKIWNNAMRLTGEQPFLLNPVNISLRRDANLTKKKLYAETFANLRSIWSEEVKKSKEYPSINPARKNNEYLSYYSPVSAGKDSIVAIRTSLRKIPEFVMFNPVTGAEEVIHRPGFMYPPLLSSAKGKIVWVETRPDIRWENRDYSVIMMIDLRSSRVSTLTRRTRYLAASISPDGKTIAAVENTASDENRLVIIDAGSGEIIRPVPSPGNSYLQHPQWSADGTKITCISLEGNNEGILSYSTSDGKWNVILKPGKDDLQSSLLRNDTLFFVSSRSGIDNIYMMNGNDTKQVTRSRFGVSDISFSGNQILFSDYTALGGNVSEVSVSTGFISQSFNKESFLASRVDSSYNDEPGKVKNVYEARPYRKWQHLFRLHSWMPFYADIDKIQSDPLSIRPGVTLMSQNSLSTFTTTVSYEYSENKKNLLHSRIRWEGLFPVIESQLDYGYNPMIYGTPAVINPGLRFSNSIAFPFNFSSGRFSQYLRPSINADYSNDIIRTSPAEYDYGQLGMSFRLFFSNVSRSSSRDIFPRWAQTADLNYNFSPFDKEIFGTTIFVKSSFFLPGFFQNNGIRIRLETEKQDQPMFLFGNSISFPRGYKNVLSRELRFASADYAFPVAYPDFNIASLFYLKRIRSVLFYDIASGWKNRHYNEPGVTPLYYDVPGKETFRSFGAGLIGDFHILRIPYMVSGGVQAAWKDISEKPLLRIIFNIDLYGFSIGKTNPGLRTGAWGARHGL